MIFFSKRFLICTSAFALFLIGPDASAVESSTAGKFCHQYADSARGLLSLRYQGIPEEDITLVLRGIDAKSAAQRQVRKNLQSLVDSVYALPDLKSPVERRHSVENFGEKAFLLCQGKALPASR